MEDGIGYSDQLFSGPGDSENTSSSNAISWNCVNLTRLESRYAEAASATIVSSLLSIFGSFLIILTYVMWKDVRKSTARAILFFLAITDLLSATGYFVSSLLYFAVDHGTHENFCNFQSIWTTYFPMTSYFWTANFAVYYFVILVLKKNRWRKKLMVVFHLTSWLIPLAICVPAIATGWLGKGLFTLSGVWCFISDQNFYNQSVDDYEYLKDTYFFMEVICGKLWEFVTYTIGMTCFVLIITCNRCRWNKFYSSSYTSKRISEAMAQTDIKLLFIPILFVIIKIWGIIRYFLSVLPNCQSWTPLDGSSNRMKDFCIKEECSFVYNPFLVIMQAFCDPLQGFVNAILFVFLSKILCCRLLDCSRSLVYRVCCCWCSRRNVNIHLQEDERSLVEIIKSKKLKKKNDVTVNGNHRSNIYNGETDMLLYGSLTTKEGWELVHVTKQV